ncbi:MAG: hypothetical protein FJ096_13480 [Deltaproteobacteria bacterium]|nr:hypothetical protein [Deltaproteobacteria bacterium]
MSSVTLTKLGLGVLAFVVSTLASTAIVVAFVVRIPPAYFVGERDGLGRRFTSPVAHAIYLLGKNVLGLLLVALGILLSLPGVPGQGLLTILVGLLLLDVPGKRRGALALVRRAPILRAMNRIRARFHRPPLVVAVERPPPDEPAASAR